MDIWTKRLAGAGVALLSLLAAARDARADGTITHPGAHPQYAVEIEPHLALGEAGPIGDNGLGIGARVSIPIVNNGFVTTINNSVAISFGAELLHYDGCYYRSYACRSNYLFLPAAMQWNFFVHPKWSVFGEPGVFIYKGFFDTCAAGSIDCREPTTFGLRAALYVGGRYQFGGSTALTMRLGYPTSSIGVSFM